MDADDLVDVFDPWERAFAKLQGHLGPPTRITEGQYEWAVIEGERCAHVGVGRGDGTLYGVRGEIIDMVGSPETVDRSSPYNRATCLEILDAVGPPENPNAPGPPTDGRVLRVDELVTSAPVGRSKWATKRVKVGGEVIGTSVSTNDAGNSLQLKNGVYCLVWHDLDPDVLGKHVIFEGTVEFRVIVPSDNEPLWEAGLTSCQVTVLEKTK